MAVHQQGCCSFGDEYRLKRGVRKLLVRREFYRYIMLPISPKMALSHKTPISYGKMGLIWRIFGYERVPVFFLKSSELRIWIKLFYIGFIHWLFWKHWTRSTLYWWRRQVAVGASVALWYLFDLGEWKVVVVPDPVKKECGVPNSKALCHIL